jgi:predicted nucleic acid-binding protein
VIVVDTAVLVYLYVEGQRTRMAEAVLVRDPVWTAPLLWRSEFRNTLAGLVKREALAIEDVVAIVAEAERAMRGREYTVVSHHVLHLAARSGCSAYDCEFVALAQDLDVPLVSADAAVIRAFPAHTITPDTFAARGAG